MRKSILGLMLLLVAVGGLASCKKEIEYTLVNESKDLDRKVLLTQWADSLVKPGYQRFDGKLTTLKSKSAAFTAAPTAAGLQELRQAWVQAYTEWQRVELFEFGPAEAVTLRNHFNIYPTDAAGIQQNIASGQYNFDLATTIPQQGFPALDYLINGVAANDAAIVQSYVASAGQRKYLADVTAKMGELFGSVYTQWTGSYRDTFVNNTGTNAGSSLSRVVNAYAFYYERFLRSGKVGIPAGTMSGVAAPEKIEAYYYKGTLPLEMAKVAHATVQYAFNGHTGGPSLKSYLNALGAKDSRTGQSLSEILNTQFGTSYTLLSALGPNLYGTMQTRRADAVTSYNEMQKAVRLIKVDMTSAMSISVTYVDNDGD